MIEQLSIDEDPYPDARRAVTFHESAPGSEEFWAALRDSVNAGEKLQTIIDEIIEVSVSRKISWAEETKTYDFRRYVMAKLGMM